MKRELQLQQCLLLVSTKEENVEVNFESNELEVPKLENVNPLYPAFSDAVEVLTDFDQGRHVVARRDIKAGELIAVEEPICSILCPEKLSNIKNQCLHCFRFTKAPLACEVREFHSFPKHRRHHFRW